MKLREMVIEDYDEIIDLFIETPGISVREADSKSATEAYLLRNPGLSYVAEEKGTIVGCVMCGHDGRRGYLQHLVVQEQHRGKGIGKALYENCIQSLYEIGIQKTHLFVFRTNENANQFWGERGWHLREDINMYSFNRSGNANV